MGVKGEIVHGAIVKNRTGLEHAEVVEKTILGRNNEMNKDRK
jgi:hypothetical protein